MKSQLPIFHFLGDVPTKQQDRRTRSSAAPLGKGMKENGVRFIFEIF